MSLCLNCGAENDPGLQECIVCGSKLENDVDETFVPFNQPEPVAEEIPADAPMFVPEMPVFTPEQPMFTPDASVEPELPMFDPNAPMVAPVEPIVPNYEAEMPMFDPNAPVVAPVEPIVPNYEAEMPMFDPNAPVVAPVEPIVPNYDMESPVIEEPVFEQPAETDISAGVPFDQFDPTAAAPVAPIDMPVDTTPYAPTADLNDPTSSYAPAPVVVSHSDDALSVGGFLFTFIMSIIPVVNLIALISWACGASKSQNRVNFARATIVMAIIVIAALVALFMTGVFDFSYIADFINGIFGQNIL